MKNNKRKIIAIIGPTASGKTGVGVKLAQEFNGEIISADSRQVFRGLDIGTGKDLGEYKEIKYHLIDVVPPGTDFSMFKWLELARAAIEDIFSRGKLPIVVGGTGLYVQALTEGFALEKTLNSRSLVREGLSREQLSNLTIDDLRDMLRKIDSKACEEVDKDNPHRLIRAIEKAQEGVRSVREKPDFDVLQIGISWPRDILYARIDKRVEERFEQGMLEEVIGLIKVGVDPDWLLKLGLEYRIITQFLISIVTLSKLGNISIKKIEEIKRGREYIAMKQELKWKIHQFARRQLTWFRRFPEIFWESDYNKISVAVDEYLNKVY